MAEAADIVDKTEQKLQAFSDALESGTVHNAKMMLNALHPAEISHLLESLPPDQRQLTWSLVNKENEGEVLMNIGDEQRSQLIKGMSPEQLVTVAEGLDIDDSADFLQSLPNTLIDQVLHSLDNQHRQRLESVLSYQEDTAGGMMNIDTITVRPEVTLDVVLRYLRLLGDIPDLTDSLIVVDRDNHYLGTLPISQLLVNDPQQYVADVMNSDSEAVPSDMPNNEVAKLFENHDLVSAAVVNNNDFLLGRITIDDVVDVIRDQADHSVLSMAGLNDEEDLLGPVIPSSRRRAIWLGINLITAFMASWVVSNFETTLEKIVTVAILMNVVASMGGIAGSQTITLVIRGLALGQVSRSNRKWIFNKEVIVSLLNGALWALVVAAIAIIWFKDMAIGAIIAVALIINLVFAASSGVIIPLVLRRFGVDPAIAGSVILTTITDIVGLLAFLGLATLFLL